ncbi:MAG: PEP-CTERM sorting domain-containing protein [Gemmatimonadaceae bacterium]
MLRRIAAVTALTLMLVAPAASSAQSCQTLAGNLVQNCSFELGNVKNGADYPNAIVTGWTPLGGPQGGTFERWTNSFDGFGAKDGNSHIELQVNGPTIIQQIIATNVGQTYDFGFWAAHRPRDKGGFSRIDVFLNNSLLISTGQISLAYQWQGFNTSFLATGSETLEFRSMGNQLSFGDFLDNVSVVGDRRVGSSIVPEPSSFAMMGIGVLLLGFAVRRKRSK